MSKLCSTLDLAVYVKKCSSNASSASFAHICVYKAWPPKIYILLNAKPHSYLLAEYTEYKDINSSLPVSVGYNLLYTKLHDL